MRLFFLLILAAFVAAAPYLVDQFGTKKAVYTPGDFIYLEFPEAGAAYVKIIDEQTGVIILERNLNVNTPSRQLIWPTTPDTPEGKYKIVVEHNGYPYVYSIQIARPVIWQFYLLAVAAAVAAGYVLWNYRHLLIPARKPPPRYRIQLPTSHAVEIGVPQMVFGREFFAKVGIPPEILRYISRNHFAIYAERGKFYIQDLGSKNGTWLNGRPIKGLNRQALHNGDVITVAQVLTLRFLYSPKFS